MKFNCLVWIVAFAAGVSVLAVDWKMEASKPERWSENSSGTMTISADSAEKEAVRFDAEIKPGTDPWLYPGFQLKDGESLAGAGVLRFEVKAETDGKSRFACVMANGKMLAFPMPVGAWKRVEVSLPAAGIEGENVKLFRVGFNPEKPGKSTFWLRNFEVIDLAKAEGEEKNAVPVFTAVESAAPSHVFYDTDAVAFTLKEAYRSHCAYRVVNGFGKEVAAGAWLEEGRGTLVLKDLPRGYYTLMLDGAKERSFREPLSFAVVAETQLNPASFFGMDTAQSWLCGANSGNERFPGERYELVSELCRRAGFGIIRERLAWAETEKTPGEFNWGKYMRNADYLHSRGMAVNGLYHDSAPWAKNKSVKMPEDLLAVYNFSKRAGEDFGGKMISWEFWNEPDGHPADPAWELTAATKAASLGFKAADPELLLLNGSFCVFPLRPFVMAALESDMLDYVDVFNYHIYNALVEYPAITKHLREILTRYGAPDMPIWITENGTRAEGMGTMKSYRPGLMMHSPKQEMIVAEFVPKGQILLQSLGVARDFFFVLTPYNEAAGQKDWGLMRQDQTVKPGYAAFANLNHQLSHAVLLGGIELAKGVRAFLYEQKDGSQSLVFWSESDVDRPDAAGEEIAVEISQPTGEYAAADLFGAVSTVRSENDKIRLNATRYPFYLNGLRGLKADREPVPAGTVARRNDAKELNIVLRPILGEEFEVAETMESAELIAPSGKITLQVWNLSPEPKSGKLTVRGAKAEGVPEQVTLKPFEKQEFALVVTPELPDGGYKGNLEFGGEFAGKPISRLVIPLVQTGKLLTEGKLLELDYRNPERWRSNASGDMQIAYDKSEDAIRFRTTFKPGADRWIYPEYILDPARESMKNAAGVTFEIKADKENISHGLNYTGMMAVLDTVKERGKAYWMVFPGTTDQWQTRVIPFANFDVEQVKMLRIGMNPKCDDFTYFIRNFKVFYDQPSKGEAQK